LQPVGKYADENVKKAVFKRFIDDKIMGGLMITEPDHGSDALGMRTNFTEHSDHYHIRGKKTLARPLWLCKLLLVAARNLCDDGALKA